MTQSNKSLKDKIMDNIKGLGGAIIAALFLRIFVLDNFYVPTGSMIPTVLIWDHLFATKWNYGWGKSTLPFFQEMFSENQMRGRVFSSSPTCGEIVIFRVPNDPKDYIKRLIGVGGDKVQIKEGVLHINGVAVKLERIEDYERLDEKGRKKTAAQYIETLPNGVKHKIIRMKTPEGMKQETTQEYVVPEGHYFMMGDNRDESGDSRYPQMGVVPHDYIKSKAQFVWLSTDGSSGWFEPWKWPFAIRYTRFFQMIR